MIELNDFYRNITYFEEYDENSFIGRWLDYSEWNDKEYWKLEKSLLKIADMYNKEGMVSKDVLMGIMRIIELLLVPDWMVFKVKDNDIYDRFDRFKYVLSKLFSNEQIELYDFFYSPELDR